MTQQLTEDAQELVLTGSLLALYASMRATVIALAAAQRVVALGAAART